MADGYFAMQFAGVGTDYPVLNEIREMYKKQGKAAPKEMASTVFYNRGVLVAALHVEAIRNAVKAKPDGKITGSDVKNGFEKIQQLQLWAGGAAAEDHPSRTTRVAGWCRSGRSRTASSRSHRVDRGVSEHRREAHQGIGRQEVAGV